MTPSLADWIAAEGAFPQTMVDRIVPATTPDDIAALAQRLGVEDQAMVKTEPFLQWVIEDRFCGPRPDFAALGAQLTADVAPWEEAKLRLLNGAHSGIAYLGGLAGIEFVDQFVALSQGRAFVEALWDESAATLSPPPGLDIARYRAALMARFANPALQHRTRQIAMDGSQKLPQRLVAPLLLRRADGRSVDALTLAIAAWMRWQGGIDDAGQSFLRRRSARRSHPRRARRLYHDRGSRHRAARHRGDISASLAADRGLVEILADHLDRLEQAGSLAALG